MGFDGFWLASLQEHRHVEREVANVVFDHDVFCVEDVGAGRLAAKVNQDYGIILAMRGTKGIAKFGQQSGLRPEPRLSGQCTRTSRLGGQCARVTDGSGIGALEGARGILPPVDVCRSHGA